MRVATQVQVDEKEIRTIVIEWAREKAGVKEAGSGTIKFSVVAGNDKLPNEITAVVEFVKAGH